jgi:hypothetical protein
VDQKGRIIKSGLLEIFVLSGTQGQTVPIPPFKQYNERQYCTGMKKKDTMGNMDKKAIGPCDRLGFLRIGLEMTDGKNKHLGR